MDYRFESKNFCCASIQNREYRQVLRALPPAAQRIREIKSLITDLRLWSLLGTNQGIRTIEKTGTGYRVAADSIALEVQLNYKRDGRRIGPAEFEFVFFEPMFFESPDSALDAAPTLEEWLAVLNDPRLYETLGSTHLIQKMERTKKGWLIDEIELYN